MNTRLTLLALVSAFGLEPSALLQAGTTIDPVNKYAYGANIGWLNAFAEGANGAVIGDSVCMGYLYSANVGWINLGSGSPANGIQYQNNAAGDFGVNQDGLGNLRGCAYGANIGWINFENTGAPKVDLRTGFLSGSVWSANCGWISLSNTVAAVQTGSIWPGLLDVNGLPTAWEMTFFGHTGVDPAADSDGDGMSNLQEDLAGTNPLDSGDYLRISAYAFAPGSGSAALTWTSKLNRVYHIQATFDPGNAIWTDSGLGVISPDGATTTRSFNDTNAPVRIFRVQAVRPLTP